MIVFGHKYQLGFKCTADVQCPSCKKAPMELHRGRKKFTLYWIPTFTMSEGYFLKCPRCNNDTLYEVDAAAAEEFQQAAAK
jgi:hypothetical protein